MLSCVPPSKEAIENMKRSIYCGASSGYKPAKVITENGIESMRWSRVGESNDDFYVGYLGDGIATKVTQYEKPYDVSQAYQKNDLVEKNGRVYQSKIDDNVWTPDLIESRISELWSEIARLEAEEKIHSQLIDTINKGLISPIYRYLVE